MTERNETLSASSIEGHETPEYRDDASLQSFWEHAAPEREPVSSRWFLPLIAILLILNVPWYLPSGWADVMRGGLPMWAWAALATSFLLAATTAVAAFTSWRDGE